MITGTSLGNEGVLQNPAYAPAFPHFKLRTPNTESRTGKAKTEPRPGKALYPVSQGGGTHDPGLVAQLGGDDGGP